MSKQLIRKVSENDSKGILDVYSYYIENTIATFETETPTLESFARRIRAMSEVYPFFVCAIENEIVGYA